MPAVTAEASTQENRSTVRDRVIDATRQAAHISHEARLLQSLAADVVEDGVHAAKRAMKSVHRRVEELGDLRDETAHRVRRQPLKAIGIAVGLGLVLGLAVGWIGGRLGKTKSPGND